MRKGRRIFRPAPRVTLAQDCIKPARNAAFMRQRHGNAWGSELDAALPPGPLLASLPPVQHPPLEGPPYAMFLQVHEVLLHRPWFPRNAKSLGVRGVEALALKHQAEHPPLSW